MATESPWSAARPAAFSPGGPAPITTTSNASVIPSPSLCGRGRAPWILAEAAGGRDRGRMSPERTGMSEASGTTSASGRDRGGLVGRRELLAVLRDQARSALGGHGRAVLLTGDAGMGKTVTAREVAAGA